MRHLIPSLPGHRGRGRPRDDALPERRREEILERAQTLFARHGYRNTDVQWVADALRVSKGTIYRYFPSKEELFLATVRRGVRRMREHIDRAGAKVADPIDRIAASVRAYLEFFKSSPQLVELFIQERSEFKRPDKPLYFEHRDAARGPWRRIIARLIAQGRLRDVPVPRIIDIVGDLLYGTMFTNYFAGRGKPFAAQARDVLDVVFNGILTPAERRRRGLRR
jgi:AcrR family transcriptional regulator